MKRITVLRVLNLVLALLLLSQAATALFHEHMPYRLFQYFHKGTGAVFITLAIVHTVLNYNWIKSNYLRK